MYFKIPHKLSTQFSGKGDLVNSAFAGRSGSGLPLRIAVPCPPFGRGDCGCIAMLYLPWTFLLHICAVMASCFVKLLLSRKALELCKEMGAHERYRTR
jgi:hypothetical protein